MEEQKKRNYERYAEAQAGAGSDDWTQDPFSAQEPSYEQPRYEEPVYNDPVAQPASTSYYGTQTTSYDGLEEPVSMGEWALSLFLTLLPCVGIIMMFIWAFSSSEKKSKSNFFKVQLIFTAIAMLLTVITTIAMMGMIGSMM